ncbi:UvrD-helicase domain-containing protein [Psychrobacter glacincola]|uniref:DNA 3'-5' helicase n=1 Tax=Psychrobacter glacincola TaxID=56810 RepID=A0ABW1W316_9GAMM|nr:ATP-dependent helicase [Psychrobacter glacincola]
MDMSLETVGIDSGDKLDDIEHHFRVLAGPGAGKTYWLVNHIKEVLHNSKRLDKSRKVACITYTNTAVEIIRDRLGSSSNQVEVSTIHSFLYRHIIKPYLHFIADDYGFNISRLDGHDDILISRSMTRDWLNQHTNQSSLKNPYSLKQLRDFPENLLRVTSWLSSIRYNLDVNNELVTTADRTKSLINGRPLSKVCLELLEIDLEAFKRLHWNKGLLHHDDVLFFSFQIIKNHPFVLDVLRTKFPYFLIDEFQDSSPIQVELLRLIGEKETIVGIIGDKAQSIFSFQGADPSQFESFELEGIKDYWINTNRRSTQEVINLLNHIRCDFKQQGQDGFNGSKPIIYIGDRLEVLHKINNELSGKCLITLSWQNITANALKKDVEGVDLNYKLFDDLKKIDSSNNSSRPRLIIPCIKAVELCREKKIKEALNELKRYFGRSNKGKRDALDLLFLLNSRYDEYCNKPLMTLYNILQTDSGIDGLSNFRAGNPKTFYDNTNYKGLALCVNIIEDTSNNITIHKSKGAEFDNVLLTLNSEKELDFITVPNLDESEEHRLKYVAISRAIQNLFITVPELSKKKAELIENLGLVDIIRLDDSLTHSTALN